MMLDCLKGKLTRVLLFVIGMLAANLSAFADLRVHIPNLVGEGSIGIYMEADYDIYEEPINIDFKKKQPGNDWRAVLSNYYHSIHTQDKDAFRALYTGKDGDFSMVEKSLKGSSFGPDVKINKVELTKAFRQGKLVIPYRDVDANPKFIGMDSVIFCDEGACNLAQDFDLLYLSKVVFPFYSSFEPPYSSQASPEELKEFHRVRGDFQRYLLEPSNLSHRTLGKPELNPNVYLNLKRYPKRWRFPLDPNLKSDVKPPADIAPIIDLFSNIKTLTFMQKIENKDLYNPMYVKAFGNDKITHLPIPLFNDRPGGYENEPSTTGLYTDRVWHWDAITPVGYLEHGEVRYIYFYPETDNYPLTKDGRSMIQILPVRIGVAGYHLSSDIFIGTSLGGLQFPEAIELAMKFFDPNIPAMEFTENDKMELEQEVVQQEVQTSGTGQPEKKAPASTSPKIVFAIVVLLMVILIVVFAIKRRKVSK